VHLPRPAARLLTRAVVRPLLSPGLPLPLRRALLDATGWAVPAPRGTLRVRQELGGVPGERVTAAGATGPHQVLYLHGGGYQTGSPASHRALTAALSRAAGAPVHVPDYRLAPEHPFPAALQDALAAWRALRAAGHPARRVAVLGDSAGAGLAMSLVLALRAAGEELPGALGLVSPWVDLDLASPWIARNAARDAMLDPGWLGDAVRSYRGAAVDAPELRPLEADLAGLPPLHVVAGAEEVLVGDADALVERARAAGVPVRYTRAARMWHAYPVLAGLLAEADEAVAGLADSVRAACAPRGRRPRVVVVGAGFGGIGMAAALAEDRSAEVTVVDRADGVGGVWLANTYPGAACDVPSHLYSFASVPGRWSRRFAPQPDILRYLTDVARARGITPRLRTEVTEARWDDTRAEWHLDLASGGTIEADVLVPACGQLSRPAVPRLPGLDSFRGPAFHSAQWRHDVDLTGRRVAVVGTGASAIQFVPAIVDRVAAMTVFQRTPPYLIPKPDAAYGRSPHRTLRPWRAAARAFWTLFFEAGSLGFTRFPAVSAPFRWAFEGLLRTQVADPELRERLRPDYPAGCKRILISSDWYPAITKPHVDLVTEAISEVTPDGVRTADGVLHPCDVIILGTGFAASGFLAPMKVFGPGGAELSERWREGAHAHLGITVPGFPNLFLLYGPNTNTGSGSIVHILESQIAYVRQAVAHIGAGGGPVAVRADVAERFDDEVQRRLARSVWTRCTSWYRTASGRIVSNWPGSMREYRRRTARFDPADHQLP
jgi:cation diffusion facilitator CzcD-associated flavoprotein CzcO/acetyl esterase/lipase